jgi:hypothetical protein
MPAATRRGVSLITLDSQIFFVWYFLDQYLSFFLFAMDLSVLRITGFDYSLGQTNPWQTEKKTNTDRENTTQKKSGYQG